MRKAATKFNLQHQTHKETIVKFLALLAILIAYFGYMSWKFDASTGSGLALLTWSFFVLCTPVAIGINVVMLSVSAPSYELTFLTNLLHQILTQPYPYWSILIISAFGTFLSIYFGDKMVDVTTHKQREKHHQHGFKHRVVVVVGMAVLTVLAYYHLLSSLNIKIPA